MHIIIFIIILCPPNSHNESILSTYRVCYNIIVCEYVSVGDYKLKIAFLSIVVMVGAICIMIILLLL